METEESLHNSFTGGLEELVEKFRANVEVKDRVYHMKTYKQCFVGKDAVKVLMKVGNISDVDEAVELGQRLLDAGEFHHVLRDHKFKNEHLFYAFTSGHGETATKV